MSGDPFAGVLDPFAYWDIASTYTRYSAFFDLVIYSAIFIAVSHVVFTRRFTGRPGKVMASAIGLALGISLAVAEQQFGFSLREAGPIAVFIALLLVGFLILHVMLRVHLSWTLAAPLTYVLLYLFLRAMSPTLFAAITARVPFINLLSAIIFLICVWKIGVAFWPKGHGAHDSESSDAGFIASLNRKNEERETKVEKRIKRKLAPEVQRETARIEHNLEALKREIKHEHPNWRGIEKALVGIAHRADGVVRVIDKIRVLDRRLRNFDWRELQELSNYCREMSDSDRQRLKEQIHLERRKIVQEHTIVELAERCERRHEHLRRLIDDAGRACSCQDRDGIAREIQAAIEIEEQQAEDVKRLRGAEKRLLGLTKLKLKKEKQG